MRHFTWLVGTKSWDSRVNLQLTATLPHFVFTSFISYARSQPSSIGGTSVEDGKRSSYTSVHSLAEAISLFED